MILQQWAICYFINNSNTISYNSWLKSACALVMAWEGLHKHNNSGTSIEKITKKATVPWHNYKNLTLHCPFSLYLSQVETSKQNRLCQTIQGIKVHSSYVAYIVAHKKCFLCQFRWIQLAYWMDWNLDMSYSYTMTTSELMVIKPIVNQVILCIKIVLF